MAAMLANFLRPSRIRKVSIFQNLLRGLTLFLANNIALHRPINIFSQNFEKIQEGRYEGQFSLYI